MAKLAETPKDGSNKDKDGSLETEKLEDSSETENLVVTPVTVLPRMELPPFDGSDLISWFAQAERFFLVHRTPLEDKVKLSLIAITGRAMFWAQWVLRRASSISWKQFTQELVQRFGDASAINAYEAMHITRQIGTLEDYLSLFEERVTQLPELPAAQYLGIVLGGLQPSIRDSIPDSELSDVFAAIRSARRVARVTRPPTTNSKLISGFQLRSTLTSGNSGGSVDSSTNNSNGSLSAVLPEQPSSHSPHGFPGPPPLTTTSAISHRRKLVNIEPKESATDVANALGQHINVLPSTLMSYSLLKTMKTGLLLMSRNPVL